MIRRHPGAAWALLLGCALTVSCTYPNEGGPQPIAKAAFTLLRSNPAPGAIDVPIDAPIDLFFDRAPAPEAIGLWQLRLYSGALEFSLGLSFDLLESRVRLTPTDPLRPDLRYRFVVHEDVRAIDGSIVGAPLSFVFTTGTRRAQPTEPPTRPSVDALVPLFAARCTGCHGQDGRAGLDLSSATAAKRSLLAPSTQSSLPRVKPYDHGRSYLLRKLLGTGIVGLPMPPDAAVPLSATELRLVASWIDGGAN